MYSIRKHPIFDITIFILGLMMPLSVKGQVGYQDKYPALKGEGTRDGGYIVRDKKIVGDTCWVCGSVWRETGERIYGLQGQVSREVLYTGFVGYFLPSMAQGENAMKYVTVPGTQCLNKMVVYPNGLAAIGEYELDRRLVVELTRESDNTWSYRLGRSTYGEEVFMDITYTGGKNECGRDVRVPKVVVLSRFDNPQHYMYYTNGIGLRYGTPGSFISTSQHLYCYFTSGITGGSELGFGPEEPLVFDKTYHGEGVAVGYICHPTAGESPYRGRWVSLMVDAEADHYPQCIVGDSSKIILNYMGFPVDGNIELIMSGEARVDEMRFYPGDAHSTPEQEVAAGVAAQPSGTDTMIGLPPLYVVYDNYQVCEQFSTCPDEYLDRNYYWLDYYAGRGNGSDILVTKAFTDHRLAVRGVALMTLTNMGDVNPDRYTIYSFDTSRVEEEIMIWQGDTLTGLAPLATARWYSKTSVIDVAVPQCTLTMEEGDDTKFLHFGLAEIYFGQSVAVDSFFFIGGTMRNNVTVVDEYGSVRYLHRPTLYPYVAERHRDPCAMCSYEWGHFVGANEAGGGWERLDGRKMWSGPFFLIPDTNRYQVTALSNNDTMGMVTGGGVYSPLDTALLVATPLDGYRFFQWSDGVTDNPRVVEVLSDTTLVAVFRDMNDTTGIDDVSNSGPSLFLYPNPAGDELFVSTTAVGQMELRLFDASGRGLMRCSFASRHRLDVSSLPAGQYYLMVRGGEGTRVESFVKR